jgi:hypothetical protein
MRDVKALNYIMWICLIVANVQMYLSDDGDLLKYFGFVPLICCWIIFEIVFIEDIMEKRK